jgi:hypothetical protein
MSERVWILNGLSGWHALGRVTDEISDHIFSLQEDAADSGAAYSLTLSVEEV